jgi:hypothetical protein
VGRHIQSHFFKVLHKIVNNEWGKQQTDHHTIGLLIELV